MSQSTLIIEFNLLQHMFCSECGMSSIGYIKSKCWNCASIFTEVELIFTDGRRYNSKIPENKVDDCRQPILNSP